MSDKPKKPSLKETLKKIYDAGGSAWDDIEDPEAYIRELRGGCTCDCAARIAALEKLVNEAMPMMALESGRWLAAAREAVGEGER